MFKFTLRKMGVSRYKREIVYEKRNMVESFFYVFKRKFGEFVESKKWENIVKEVMLKVSIINCFVNIGSLKLSYKIKSLMKD